MPTPIRAMRRSTFAAPLMALAALTASDASAYAAAECLAAPKGSAPQGSHWYYRWDREGQRRCWYVAAWKGTTARDTTRVRTAGPLPAVPQVSDAQQRVSDPWPATWRDVAAQQSNEDRIRRLLYGTEESVEGGALPQLELRRSLAPMRTADADEGRRPMAAAPALQSTPAGAPDEVASDTLVPAPPIVAAQTGPVVTPAQMMLYAIAMLAISGCLFHVSVRFARARRQRARINRRSAHVLAAPRHTQRALPPDRVRRFA